MQEIPKKKGVLEEYSEYNIGCGMLKDHSGFLLPNQ